VSAAVDVEEEFVALLQGGWHLEPGHAGAALTHTTVLVTHGDGRKSLARVANDRFLRLDDEAGIRARLAAAGVRDVAAVSLEFSD
jgi:hypothetical protein